MLFSAIQLTAVSTEQHSLTTALKAFSMVQGLEQIASTISVCRRTYRAFMVIRDLYCHFELPGSILLVGSSKGFHVYYKQRKIHRNLQNSLKLTIMSFATYRNRNFVNFLKIIHIKYELILKKTQDKVQ